MKIQAANDLEIYHNTFSNNASAIAMSMYDATSVDVFNNLFHGGGRWIEVPSPSVVPSPELRVDYNWYFAPQSGARFLCDVVPVEFSGWQQCDGRGWDGSGSNGIDPQFAPGAFSLDSGSPAIDTAHLDPFVSSSTGLLYCGSGPDHGAFEKCQ